MASGVLNKFIPSSTNSLSLPLCLSRSLALPLSRFFTLLPTSPH